LVVSPEIPGEYQRVAEIMSDQFPKVDPSPIINLLAVEAKLVLPPGLPEAVCVGPDDDKFLACALASRTKFIIGGDRHLLNVSSYRGIKIVRPRRFVDEYLKKREGS